SGFEVRTRTKQGTSRSSEKTIVGQDYPRHRSPVGLSRGAQGELVPDVDAVRNPVALNPHGSPGAKGLGAEIGAGLAHDHHMDRLAQPLIGDAGAQSRRDLRMLAEEILDLHGRDLVAAARDDLLEAPDDLDPPVRAEPRQVSGLEKTVGKG